MSATTKSVQGVAASSWDGSSEATVGLFRLDKDGHTASRVPVQLGRGSVNAIEVLKGLEKGDQVSPNT